MTVAAAPDLLSPARLTLLQPMRAPRMPRDIEACDARGVLVTALGSIGASRLPLVTSLQPEGIVILHLLTKLVHRPRVITIDTGRLPSETYDLIDRVRDRFGVDIEVILPAAAEVEPMVRERGANLFYRSTEDRLRCCEVRKVLPLRRALEGAGAGGPCAPRSSAADPRSSGRTGWRRARGPSAPPRRRPGG